MTGEDEHEQNYKQRRHEMPSSLFKMPFYDRISQKIQEKTIGKIVWGIISRHSVQTHVKAGGSMTDEKCPYPDLDCKQCRKEQKPLPEYCSWIYDQGRW